MVVGGGPAGSATATLLVRRGLRVTLLDKARFPRRKPCAEYLSPGAAALLEDLGVDTRGGRWLRGMQVIAPNGARHLVEYGAGQHALAIQRSVLDARLLQVARDAGVEVREGQRVEGLLWQAGAVRGVVATGQALTTGWVVGADGLNSAVGRALRVRRRTVWPPRLGLVAHLRGVDWPEDIGRMWVGGGAYVGVAPVGDGVLTVGLVRGLPRRGLGSVNRALQAELARFGELSRRLRGAQMLEPVQGVGPLGSRVRTASGRGWLLVGDAAGFFDPFTGEGLYRALCGAHLAAEAVEQALRGDPRAAENYARTRRQAFGAKERLTALIQVFVRVPGLMNYVVDRLQRRPPLAEQFARVLGDLAPAQTADVWGLLSP